MNNLQTFIGQYRRAKFLFRLRHSVVNPVKKANYDYVIYKTTSVIRSPESPLITLLGCMNR